MNITGLTGVWLDLLSQTTNMNIHRSCISREVCPPDLPKQHITAVYLARIRNQKIPFYFYQDVLLKLSILYKLATFFNIPEINAREIIILNSCKTTLVMKDCFSVAVHSASVISGTHVTMQPHLVKMPLIVFPIVSYLINIFIQISLIGYHCIC